MKKIIKLCLATVLAMSLSSTLMVSTFAQEAFSTPMQEIKLDSSDVNSIESIIAKYGLQPQTAETIRAILRQSKSGSSRNLELSILIPDISTKGTRTYVGFGNKTYYEEIVRARNSSRFEEVGGALWSNYSKSTIKAICEFIVDGAIDSATMGSWSIAKLFSNPGVSANADIAHVAALIENKDIKHTYVVENGQYYFGSLTEQAASTYFQNMLRVPGSSYEPKGTNTTIPKKSTPNYSTADKRAYYGYVSSGWTEHIDGYTYGGQYYVSITG